ncbi:F-box/LRR-repeat protein 18-like [Amphiura filiformis]|uniref:F-box/LRR-repeat protein 18-like n=1 Tax=Amphiura filiformis TaxID=82378 RepID=UPI003B21F098
MGGSESIQTNLQCLSDEVLLHIISYLALSDRVSLSRVSQRFSNLCIDVSLMRYLDGRHDWNLDADTLIGVLRGGGQHIRHLDFAYCYWLHSKNVTKCVIKCPNLDKLDLRSCSVTPKDLDKILSVTVSLKHLAVTDAGAYVVRTDAVLPPFARNIYCMSDKACDTLRGLVEVNLIIDSKCTKGLYVLSMCENVTMLSVFCSGKSKSCSCDSFTHLELDTAHNMFECMTNVYIDPLLPVHHKLVWIALVTLLHGHPVQTETGLPYMEELEHVSMKNSSQSHHNVVTGIAVKAGPDIVPLFMRFPERLDCFHIHAVKPGSHVANHWSDILEHLTTVTSLLMPLQLIDIDKEGVSKRWMTSLVALCSHVKHLSFLDSLCHIQNRISKNMLIDINEFWDSVAKNVTKDLLSLAVPPCFVLDKESCLKLIGGDSKGCKEKRQNDAEHSGPQGFGRRQRVGESSTMASSSTQSLSHELGGPLEKCISSCPLLEKFEVMPSVQHSPSGAPSPLSAGILGLLDLRHPKSFCAAEHLVKDNHLACISQWKHLSSLTLAWLPGILHGKCLIEITKGCSRLRFLSLAYIGLQGGCVYQQALCEALKYAKSLQDLRVEQPYLRVNDTLCKALQHCTQLTRLCLLTLKSQFSHNGVLSVFHECKNLCVLHIVTGSSGAACKRLTTDLNARYKEQRPALNVCITTGNDRIESLGKVAQVHMKEVILLRSHVCDKPIGWNGLSPV